MSVVARSSQSSFSSPVRQTNSTEQAIFSRAVCALVLASFIAGTVCTNREIFERVQTASPTGTAVCVVYRATHYRRLGSNLGSGRSKSHKAYRPKQLQTAAPENAEHGKAARTANAPDPRPHADSVSRRAGPGNGLPPGSTSGARGCPFSQGSIASAHRIDSRSKAPVQPQPLTLTVEVMS
jgi:hypothetical protein